MPSISGTKGQHFESLLIRADKFQGGGQYCGKNTHDTTFQIL